MRTRLTSRVYKTTLVLAFLPRISSFCQTLVPGVKMPQFCSWVRANHVCLSCFPLMLFRSSWNLRDTESPYGVESRCIVELFLCFMHWSKRSRPVPKSGGKEGRFCSYIGFLRGILLHGCLRTKKFRLASTASPPDNI